METQKQTVYLPVEEASAITDAIVSNNKEDFITYCLEKEGYFFTPEEFNQLLTTVMKKTLNNAAQKATTTLITPIEDGLPDYKNSYESVNRESIMNTFDEIFNKLKV